MTKHPVSSSGTIRPGTNLLGTKRPGMKSPGTKRPDTMCTPSAIAKAQSTDVCTVSYQTCNQAPLLIARLRIVRFGALLSKLRLYFLSTLFSRSTARAGWPRSPRAAARLPAARATLSSSPPSSSSPSASSSFPPLRSSSSSSSSHAAGFVAPTSTLRRYLPVPPTTQLMSTKPGT